MSGGWSSLRAHHAGNSTRYHQRLHCSAGPHKRLDKKKHNTSSIYTVVRVPPVLLKIEGVVVGRGGVFRGVLAVGGGSRWGWEGVCRERGEGLTYLFRVSPSPVGRVLGSSGKTDGLDSEPPETNRESQQHSGAALVRLRVRLEGRVIITQSLGKSIGLDSEPFLKPIGRANSTQGQPYVC